MSNIYFLLLCSFFFHCGQKIFLNGLRNHHRETAKSVWQVGQLLICFDFCGSLLFSLASLITIWNFLLCPFLFHYSLLLSKIIRNWSCPLKWIFSIVKCYEPLYTTVDFLNTGSCFMFFSTLIIYIFALLSAHKKVTRKAHNKKSEVNCHKCQFPLWSGFHWQIMT